VQTDNQESLNIFEQIGNALSSIFNIFGWQKYLKI
jgi:hypothetical protein